MTRRVGLRMVRTVPRRIRTLVPNVDLKVDLPIVAVVAALTVPLSTFGIEATVQGEPYDSFGIVLLTLFPVALLWRRSYPLTVTALLAVVVTVHEARPYSPTLATSALWVSLYSAGRHGNGPLRVPVAAFAVAFPPPVTALFDKRVADATVELVLSATMFLIGDWARRRDSRLLSLEQLTVQLETERSEHARRAIAMERRRIARELHDIIAHGLGLIVVQASAARHVLAGTEAEQPLRVIDAAGRQAIAEMRTLLTMLREDDEYPVVKGVAQLPELVEQAQRSGVAASVEIRGDARPLPALTEMSLYRIVQESLTNIAKHAMGASAVIELDYQPEAVVVRIVNGPSISGHRASVSGFGLLGMRERAAVLKGTFEARATPAGGFEVEARLPAKPEDSAIVAS